MPALRGSVERLLEFAWTQVKRFSLPVCVVNKDIYKSGVALKWKVNLFNIPVAVWVTQTSELETNATKSHSYGQIWQFSLAPPQFVLSSSGVKLDVRKPVSTHWNMEPAAGNTIFPDSKWTSYDVIPEATSLFLSHWSCSSFENFPADGNNWKAASKAVFHVKAAPSSSLQIH